VSKFATDRFNALASDFLPFVFFAKHDLDEQVKEQFEKTWIDNVGGSRAVVLYSREINTLSIQRLESPKWTIKHTAALTIADVVTSSGTSISGANAAVIWPALEKALALKTFDGKEKVLEAFVRFTKESKSLWGEESSIAAQMKKIAIREAKRNNDAYRPHAFASLGEYSEIRSDIDIFDEVYNIINPILEELLSDDKMDMTDDATSGGKTHESTTITASITALFRAVNIKHLDPSPLTHLPKLLEVVKKTSSSTKATVATKIAFYERTKAMFDGLRKRTHSQGSKRYELAIGFFTSLEVFGGSGSEAMRQKRAEAAEMIVEAFIGGVFGTFAEGRETCRQQMKAMATEGRKSERSPTVQAVLDRLLKALDE
jgi:proteasome component ECM29